MTTFGSADAYREKMMNPHDTPAQFTATDSIAGKLGDLRDEMRTTIRAVHDPQGRALPETGAEVLGGLRQAFLDYADGAEEAWQR